MNWIIENLENALETWNSKMAEIFQLVTQSPETFKEVGYSQSKNTITEVA